MSWKALKDNAPDLAEFGKKRFASEVTYLATIKKDGSPRVHPVTPIIGGDYLFVFMEPTSPKGHDLRRDGRYALHCSVGDSEGTGGEFLITGIAKFTEDEEKREIATRHASYEIISRYILFELGVDTAFSNVYGEDGKPVRKRWRRDRE
jgi:hypothetical protein